MKKALIILVLLVFSFTASAYDPVDFGVPNRLICYFDFYTITLNDGRVLKRKTLEDDKAIILFKQEKATIIFMGERKEYKITSIDPPYKEDMTLYLKKINEDEQFDKLYEQSPRLIRYWTSEYHGLNFSKKGDFIMIGLYDNQTRSLFGSCR